MCRAPPRRRKPSAGLAPPRLARYHESGRVDLDLPSPTRSSPASPQPLWPMLLLAPKLARPVALVGGVALIGCGIPSHSTRLAGGPEPVDLRMEPSVLRSGQEATVVVRSASADSIAIESENGVDRYWSGGPGLAARLSADFGDRTLEHRYAER